MLELLKPSLKNSVFIYRMYRYLIKIVLALGLAVLVYSIGMPGCSLNQWVAMGGCNGVHDVAEHCEATPIDIADPLNDIVGPFKRNYEKVVYDLVVGKVDIIFVMDNSSSMAREHRNISDQFKNFLRNVSDVDYRMAVITTDISSSPGNPVRNASYQDGRFISIAGRPYLENENIGGNPDRGIVREFQKALNREETIKCDSRNQPRSSGNVYDDYYQNTESQTPIDCPSADERGIYALNLALRNNPNFFREKAHLMIVIVSDEDVRSSEHYISQSDEYSNRYNLENLDLPETLAENIYSHLGPSKRFSVHSIIIPPGDRDCLESQNRHRSGRGTGRGYYGEQYARLSKARDYELTKYGNLLKGEVISICDKRYGAQLQKVSVDVNTIKAPLPCPNPESIDLYVDGKRIGRDYEIEGGQTLIMKPRNVKLNSRIRLEVICEV